MTTLIRNGTVILPDKTCKADILLQDGRVAAVASDLAIENAASVDAGGCLVLPGGIDVHTHITLDLDAALGTDLYYRGTLPALAGGTTSIIDHMAFMPKGRSPDEQAALYLDLAKGQSVVDYAFHGVIQPGYEFEDLKRLAARGVTSVKAYMTYAGRLDDATLLGLLKDCRKLGLLLAVHAEDHDCVESRKQAFKAAGRGEPIWHAASRPAECEAKAVAR
ncbi:amidohydrolase family protein, partial [Desulfovibrio sp. OttesenSCG-928-M16]|nr:amidohydrolase family protein [Desulfovibrio sp. OttesenSCG-928-M16]